MSYNLPTMGEGVAIQELRRAMKKSGGMYETTIEDPSSPTYYLLHDKPNLKDSKIVLRLMDRSISLSLDGGNTYIYSFDLSYDVISDILSRNGVSLSWINTGTFNLKDSETDSVLMSISITGKDPNGINTGSAKISSKSVVYNNISLDEHLNDVDQAIEDIESVTITEVQIQYCSNKSTSIAPSQDDPNWSTIAPPWKADEYIWQRTVTTYTDSTEEEPHIEYSNPVCISGANGQSSTSLTIVSQDLAYLLSDDPTNHPEYTDPSWSSEIPEPDPDKPYLWTMTSINFSDNTTVRTFTVSSNGTNGRGIKSTTIEYNISTIGTYPPEEGWTAEIPPTTNESPFLWTRITIEYTDGSDPDVSYSISRISSDGSGINTITNYYALTKTPNPPSDSEWVTEVPVMTSSDRYLWNYEVITYTGNKPATETAKRIIGVYGTAGRGVSNITEYYLASPLSEGVLVTTEGWTTNPSEAIISVDNKYLWNYEKVEYTDGSTPTNTDPAIIGIYGEGEDGRGIESVINYYLASNVGFTGFNVVANNGNCIINGITAYTEGDGVVGLLANQAVTYSDDMLDGNISITSEGISTETEGWSTDAGSQIISEEKPYLWNYEEITYTDGSTSTKTQPVIISTYVTDGRGISNIEEYYLATDKASGVTLETEGWTTDISEATLTDIKKYLWNYEVIYYTSYTEGVQDRFTSNPVLIGTYGKQGSDAYNNATIFLYRRSETEPDSISHSLTYTFATGELSNPDYDDPLDGWSRSIYAATTEDNKDYPLWVMTATAINIGSDDTIQSEEWTSPIVMAENGEDGVSGYNQATIYLYKRSQIAPDKPTNAHYTFSTGEVTGTGIGSSGWRRDIPSGSDPCYVTSVSAISRDDEVDISDGDWSTVIKLVENGSDGYNYAVVFMYKRYDSESTPTPPSDNLEYTFSSAEITGNTDGWTQNAPEYSTDPCYVISTSIVSRTPSVSISSNDWSTPVKFVESGTSGESGYNQANIYLYRRSDTQPTTKPGRSTYTFSSGVLECEAFNNWSTTIPTNNGKKLWITVARAISRDDTYTIESSKWTTAVEMSDSGIGITSIVEHYLATSKSSGVTIDSDTWTTDPDEAVMNSQDRFLWNYETINYSYGDPVNTDPAIIGTYGSGINTITEYYAVSDSNTNPPTGLGAWTTDPSAVELTPENKYLWNYEVVEHTDGTQEDPTTPIVIGVYGDTGDNGYSQITVTLYKRISEDASEQEKQVPLDNALTYDFRTGSITGNFNGWTQSIPDNSGENRGVPCYVTSAIAISNTMLTTKLVGFTTATKILEDGYNYASIFLYKKSTSKPNKPPTMTYKFSTGELTAVSGSMDGWSREIPDTSDGSSSYVSTAIAIGTEETDTILQSEWTSPILFGANGKGIAEVIEWYLTTDKSTGVTRDTAGWSRTITQVTVDKQYMWNYEEIVYTYGANTYTEPALISMYGNSISSITNYYAVNNDVSTSPDDSEFSTDMAVMSPENRYLWNYEVIAYTNGATSSKTEKRIIGVYGNGVRSITEYYLAYESDSGVTEDTPGWTTVISSATISGSKPYLWNYEVIEYVDDTETKSDPVIIGVYGNGIASITNYYLASNTSSSSSSSSDDGNGNITLSGINATAGIVSGAVNIVTECIDDEHTSGADIVLRSVDSISRDTPGWSTTVPETNEETPYLWNYEDIEYTNGSHSYTEPVVIGRYVTNGTSININSVGYKVGASGTNPPIGDDWTDTVPEVPDDMYLWTRTVYSDGHIAYSVAKQGSTGTSVSISSTEVKYAISFSSVTPPASESDWHLVDSIPTTTINNPYLWTRTIVNYSDGSRTVSYSVGYGYDVILLRVTAPTGNIIANDENTVSLYAELMKNGLRQTDGVIYQWYRFDGEYYISISGENTNTLVVTKDMVSSYNSFRCTVTYKSVEYSDYFSVYDKTDPVQITVLSTLGSQIKNSIGNGAVYTLISRGDTEVDPMYSDYISTTAPSSPEIGDYWYYINKTNRNIVLREYTESGWIDIVNPHRNYYKWSFRDSDGNKVSSYIADGTRYTYPSSGKIIYLDAHMIDSKITIDVEVTM